MMPASLTTRAQVAVSRADLPPVEFLAWLDDYRRHPVMPDLFELRAPD